MNLKLPPALEQALAGPRARAVALARRIDALSLRERVILFLSLSLVLLALFDRLVLTPLATEREQQRSSEQKLSQELTQLRERFAQLAQQSLGDGQTALLRRRVQTAKQRLAAQAQDINAGAPAGTAPLSALLSTLLQKHQGLSLHKVETLNDAPPHARGIALNGLAWQGVELQLAGDYRELTGYLKDLEQAWPELHWGEMRLQSPASGEPNLLQLQLYVLKVAP